MFAPLIFGKTQAQQIARHTDASVNRWGIQWACLKNNDDCGLSVCGRRHGIKTIQSGNPSENGQPDKIRTQCACAKKYPERFTSGSDHGALYSLVYRNGIPFKLIQLECEMLWRHSRMIEILTCRKGISPASENYPMSSPEKCSIMWLTTKKVSNLGPVISTL